VKTAFFFTENSAKKHRTFELRENRSGGGAAQIIRAAIELKRLFL